MHVVGTLMPKRFLVGGNCRYWDSIAKTRQNIKASKGDGLPEWNNMCRSGFYVI